MKINVVLFAVLCLLAISVVPIAAAKSSAQNAGQNSSKNTANIAGKWALTSLETQGAQTRILTLIQNGEKLTGTLKSQLVSSPVEGAVNGNKVTFTVKMRTPHGEAAFIFAGTTEGDTMKGTVKMDDADVSWTASQIHE